MSQLPGGPGLSLVVPLFNEEARVAESGGALVNFVSQCGPGSELLFVDDGSTDRTTEVVEALVTRFPDVVRLLRRPHRGKGAAVRAGLAEAQADYGRPVRRRLKRRLRSSREEPSGAGAR